MKNLNNDKPKMKDTNMQTLNQCYSPQGCVYISFHQGKKAIYHIGRKFHTEGQNGLISFKITCKVCEINMDFFKNNYLL